MIYVCGVSVGLKKMNTQTLILAILNFEDASGYEIKKHSTEGAFSYFVDISYGSIYPTLSRLEKEGLVTCRAEAQEGKPDKKVYSITGAGRAEFMKALQAPHQKDKFRSEFLLIAMCANITPKAVIERAVDGHIEEVNGIKQQITELLSECDDASTQWIADYGMHVMNAKLDFVTQNRGKLIAMAMQDSPLKEAAE